MTQCSLLNLWKKCHSCFNDIKSTKELYGLCDISAPFQGLQRAHHVVSPQRPRLWSFNCWLMHKWTKICIWHNAHCSIYGRDVTYASMHQIHKRTLWVSPEHPKTKVLLIGEVDDEAKQLTIDNNVVESADSLVYLGAQIHTYGESSMDIRKEHHDC